MKYDPKLDETLWMSEKYEFKPTATIHAEIRRYKKGNPKVLILEEGTGFNGKPYKGTLLRRVGSVDIDAVLGFLTEAKRRLVAIEGDGSSRDSKESLGPGRSTATEGGED